MVSTALGSRSIAVVAGTRPEVIKLAGIVRLLGDVGRLLHTGQHYDPELDSSILSELGVGMPVMRLEVGGSSRGAQIGEATRLLDAHFADLRPRAVVVQGDTNSALAAALAANARELPLVHVEAGLRSFDRRLPEEHNRVLIDHVADLCCAPTATARANLDAEGIRGRRVALTGNTVVEAVVRMLPDRVSRVDTLARMGLVADRFVLATIHRSGNVDDREILESILYQLASLPLPVVFPVHPRTAQQIHRFALTALLDQLRPVPPAGYGEFLTLAKECAFLVSDSGGVQEEASVLKRPVLVVRASTERPEVEGTFATLVKPGPDISEAALALLEDLSQVHDRLARLPTPYGDGTASARCVAAMTELLSATGGPYAWA